MRTFRLVIACPDRVGIVAKVSSFLATYNGWITEASHHSDNQSGWFFMRHEIRADSLPFDLDGFRQAFAPIAREFSMEWRITDSAQKKRVVLARTAKVPPKWQEILYQLGGGSYFFMVEFYERSLEPLDNAQMTALLYHELRKITPEGGVVPPDVHDWYQMIQGLGRHWFYPDATCPDLLAEGVDWKKLMGSFYEAPLPSEA